MNLINIIVWILVFGLVPICVMQYMVIRQLLKIVSNHIEKKK